MKNNMQFFIGLLLIIKIVSCNVTLIESHGYKAEEHTVETEDGYILTMFRIPNPGKPAVFLQHGIFCFSTDWLMFGPNKSLAYKLADAEFDVWLGNTRGNNYYSKQHKNFSVSQKEFWDYSLDELGYYDLPAMINNILSLTKQPNLHYIGHSQGTTVFFEMAPRRQEMNDKIKSMHAIGPAAFFNHVTKPEYQMVLTLSGPLKFLAQLFNMYEWIPSKTIINKVMETDKITSPGFIDLDRSVSTKIREHFVQLSQSGMFRMFAYGDGMNMLKYNQLNPPEYNLTDITVPIHLYYGKGDTHTSYQDAVQLSMVLKNLKGNHTVNIDNHLELVWNFAGRNTFYEIIIDELKNLEKLNEE